jgi:hypothetical protein
MTKRLVISNTDGEINVNANGTGNGGGGLGEANLLSEVGVQVDSANSNDKGKAKLYEDDVIERKTVKGIKKHKEKLNGSDSLNESSYQVVKSYRRAVINGRAKMVEVPYQ